MLYGTVCISCLSISRIGVNKRGYIKSVEFVEPAVIGQWKRAPDLPHNLADAAAVAIHDDVFVFGGTDGQETFDAIIRLDETEWRAYSRMLRPRCVGNGENRRIVDEQTVALVDLHKQGNAFEMIDREERV